MSIIENSNLPNVKTGYNRFLLLIAGLGGLLYGVDVGVIASVLADWMGRKRLMIASGILFVASTLSSRFRTVMNETRG